MTLELSAEKLAKAISNAEGFPIPNSLPARIHNPGDLELGDEGFGVKNGKTIYGTDAEGWGALKRECLILLGNHSHYIRLSMTIFEFARIYTGNDNAAPWAAVVARDIGVTAGSTLQSFLDLA